MNPLSAAGDLSQYTNYIGTSKYSALKGLTAFGTEELKDVWDSINNPPSPLCTTHATVYLERNSLQTLTQTFVK